MVDSSFDFQAALLGCARKDPLALQQLYAQEAPSMLALANIILNDQAAAQNAVHDAFVLIWKNADSYDARTGNARAWIYSIMRYRTLNLLRQNPPAAKSPLVTPSLLSFREESASGIAAALARQPEGARRPVLMAFYNGLSYSAISAKLGSPVSDLRTRARSCLRALQGSNVA